MVDRPNIVVIVADTFRGDHLGAYGNPGIRTPHLDEFARSSVVFDNHVVSSFPTMPARADVLTGTFSFTHMGWKPLPRHLLTLGGPDDEPELYDLTSDPGEQNNVWRELGAEGEVLCERTISFLESVGTPESYLAPRREALDRWWRVIRSKSA